MKNREEEEKMSRDCTKRTEIRFLWIRDHKVDFLKKKVKLKIALPLLPIKAENRQTHVV